MLLLRRVFSIAKKFSMCLVAAGLLTSCSVNNSTEVNTQVPYDSFVYVKGDASDIKITACTTGEDVKCNTVTDKNGLHIRGSGVVVANSVVDPERQYVMTAGHVCNTVDQYREDTRNRWRNDYRLNVTEVDLTLVLSIVDNDNRTFRGKVIGLNTDRDICIIAIKGSKLPIIRIAQDYPDPGAKIFNLAAPLGMWQAGSTHRFDGYFSGPYRCAGSDKRFYKCEIGEHVWNNFTLAATHGSSGSPIFNWDGELIGILVMVTRNFPNLVYAVRLEDMKELLEHVMEFEASPEGLQWDPDFKNYDSISGATVKVAPDESSEIRLRYHPG